MARSSRSMLSDGVLSHKVLRISGIVILIQGVCLLCVGLANIIYTAVVYTSAEGCITEDIKNELVTDIDPCDNSDILVYTWVASPVWCGLITFITGMVGASLRTNYRAVKSQVTAYSVLAGLTACIFSPACVVLSALDINAGRDVFIQGSASDLDIKDAAKFSLPLICCLMAALISIVCFVVIFHVCTSTNPYQDDRDKRYDPRDRSRGKWRKDLRHKHPYYGYDNKAYMSQYMYPGYQGRSIPYHPYYSQSEMGYRTAYPTYPYPNQFLSLPSKHSHKREHKERLYAQNGAATREYRNGYLPNGYYTKASSYNGSVMNGNSRSYTRQSKSRNINDAIDDMFDFRDVAKYERDSASSYPRRVMDI